METDLGCPSPGQLHVHREEQELGGSLLLASEVPSRGKFSLYWQRSYMRRPLQKEFSALYAERPWKN